MITNLDIQGYKSIKKQKVVLKNINILIGGNGIGKSNFISAFTLMRSLYEKELQAFVLKKGGANALLYMGKKQTDEMTIDMTFENNGYENRYIVNFQEAQDGLMIKKTQTAFLYNGVWKIRTYDVDVKEASIKDAIYNQAGYVKELMKQFMVYHFHDAGDKSPMKGFASLHDNTTLKYDGSNIAAYLYFLQEKYPKHFKRIEMSVKEVSPFFESFSLKPNRLNEETIRLEWKQKGAEDTYFNAYQLSDGTLRFICLATLLLQPSPPKTIIIDEPELGLHPQAINKLSALIKKTIDRSQIIISTQSVNLVDNFEPDDIIVVDMKDGASDFQRLDGKKLEVWLDDYSLGEVWEKNVIGGQPF